MSIELNTRRGAATWNITLCRMAQRLSTPQLRNSPLSISRLGPDLGIDQPLEERPEGRHPPAPREEAVGVALRPDVAALQEIWQTPLEDQVHRLLALLEHQHLGEGQPAPTSRCQSHENTHRRTHTREIAECPVSVEHEAEDEQTIPEVDERRALDPRGRQKSE